jgi:hypothetical protein
MPASAARASDVLRRFAPVEVADVGADECVVTVCTSNIALDDDLWVMEGIDLSRYLAHPVVLRDHDMTQPVARASDLKVTPQKITARATFPQMGVSAKADETRGLVKGGFITGISASIAVLESEPLDPRNPRGGRRITRSILLEFSFVSVPCDAMSGVTARSRGERTVADKHDWKVGAARGLPIDASDDWDGGEAAQAIFDHAGGDDFDPAEARRGFLFYDAENPSERTAYKFPIALVKDGELVVPKGAIRAAAADLPKAKDIPDDVLKKGEAVIDAYKKKAKIGDDDGDDAERAIRAAHRRMLGAPRRQRGLYEVASLCYLMAGLNYQAHTAKAEQALEGDDSEVPGMLLNVLHGLGAALVAMTQEEVEEVLDGHGVDEDELDAVEDAERAFVLGARSTRARAFRFALVQLRAGKAISKTNAEKLEEADEHHDRALKHNRGVAEAHDAAGGHLEKARASHRAAEAAVKDGGDGAGERALKHIRAAGEHLGDLADAHADAGDGCRAAIRSVKAARRCVRAVLGQAGQADDADPEPATEDDSERQRRARALQLKAKALAFAA